ncbi:sodium channel subunit beta-3 [Leptonychotes weddellii]|uniref:Sodium channel regulatory subunit beta-3 n=1 Tax=Leptonychotes weddellii TaxID=9713 RepID=A0A7F8PWJ6_LEPWE|nr:sodium channel subunit beta-3 [Leptonychotes weddellii]
MDKKKLKPKCLQRGRLMRVKLICVQESLKGSEIGGLSYKDGKGGSAPLLCPVPIPALLPNFLSWPYSLLLLYLQIYEYRNGQQEVESPFQGRLQWNGSKDLQDVSITVLNVTLNDSGLYTCNVSREFAFEAHRPFVKTTRLIPLRVTEEAGEDFTSVVSEIMMYILLVFLTLWLLIEMIYCYRKVSKAEEAAQENA